MIVSANGSYPDGFARFLLGSLEEEYQIVVLSHTDDYAFNSELLNLTPGGYYFFDFNEYGAKTWDRTATHIFGRNSADFGLDSEEWQKFENWIKDNPPALMFKRELLEQDRSEYILPLEYPALVRELPPVQTEEEFNARPIELMHYWGHSHESRRTFQGNAWLYAVRHNVTLCDNLNHLNGMFNPSRPTWVSTNIPDFARLPLPNVMMVNGMAKLSLCLPGAGVKCVRHAESPVNSVMVMQQDNLAWSYPWVHGVNSIKVEIGMDPFDLYGISGSSPEIPAIVEALKRDDLYQIYLAGVENCQKYILKNYLSDYIRPKLVASQHG